MAAHVGLEDRVRDTTTTSGTGSYTLGGTAPSGSVAIATAFATGVTLRYFVTDGGANWEDVTGVFTSPSTLTRATIEASSNSNNAVNWADSTSKTIFVAPSARDLVYQLPTFLGTSGGSANAHTLTPATVLRAYRAGMVIRFLAGFTNTSTATMNISALGTRTMKKITQAGKAALTGSEIIAGGIYDLVDDGTDLLLMRSEVLSKVVSFTRDISTASGSQAVTGVGFKPTSVLMLATRSDSGTAGWSSSMADSALGTGIIAGNTDANVSIGTVNILYGNQAGTTSYSGALASYDSDGFTLNWTKTGSPTGTLTVKALCLR